MSTGFYEHGMTIIGESRRKLIDLRLQQRLTTRKLDHLAVVVFDFGHDLIERHLLATAEGKLRVAPTTPEITPGSAHEHARQPGIARFTLYALIDFGDPHR